MQNIEVALALRRVEEAFEVTATSLPSVFSPGSTHLSGERLHELPLTQLTNLPDAIVTAAPIMIRGHDDFVLIRGHEMALLAVLKVDNVGMTCIGGFDGERCAALARLDAADEPVYVILLGIPDESAVKHDRLRVAFSHGFTTEEG